MSEAEHQYEQRVGERAQLLRNTLANIARDFSNRLKRPILGGMPLGQKIRFKDWHTYRITKGPVFCVYEERKRGRLLGIWERKERIPVCLADVTIEGLSEEHPRIVFVFFPTQPKGPEVELFERTKFTLTLLAKSIGGCKPIFEVALPKV